MIKTLLLVSGLLAFYSAWRLAGQGEAGLTGSRIGLWHRVQAVIWPFATVMAILLIHAQGQDAQDQQGGAANAIGKTRVAVLEVGIGLGDVATGMSFGGDPERDEIVIAELPAQALRVAQGADGPHITLKRDPGFPCERIAVFVDGARAPCGRPLALPQSAALAVHIADQPVPQNRPLAELEKAGDVNIFTLEQGKGGGWIVAFAAPEFFHIAPGNIRLASANTRNPVHADVNVTPFAGLGAGFDASFDNTELVLPRASGSTTLVRGSEREQMFPNARVVIEQGGYRTVLRVDPLLVDSGLRGMSWWVMILLVLLSAVLSWRVRRSAPLMAALLGAAELLLVLRVVLAIDGTMVMETERARQALPDALLALPLGLLVMHAAVQPLRAGDPGAASTDSVRTALRSALALAILAASAALIGRAVEHEMPGALAAAWQVKWVGGALTFAVLAGRAILSWPAAMTWLGAAFRYCVAIVSRWRFVSLFIAPFRLVPAPHRAWMPALMVLLSGSAAIVLMKMVFLLGFGVAERGLFALSTIYIPCTLIAFLPLFFHALRGGKPLATGGVILLAGLASVLLTHSLIANGISGLAGREGETADIGLAIVLVFGLGMVGAAIWSVRRERASWGAWAASFVMAGAGVRGLAEWLMGNTDMAFGLFGAVCAIGAVTIVAALIAAPREAAEDAEPGWASGALWTLSLSAVAAVILLTSLEFLQPAPGPAPSSTAELPSPGRARVRLTAALAPERLGFMTDSQGKPVGARESLTHLALYGGEDAGAGYLGVPIAQGVRKQQFSDFAIAVHFVYPFGRGALGGLLLFLGSLVVLAYARLSERSWPVLLGIMSLTTFVAACVYIALSNLLLAPVTGRNFYLLAPQSHSDLLEGLLLLAGAAVLLGSGVRREESNADAD